MDLRCGLISFPQGYERASKESFCNLISSLFPAPPNGTRKETDQNVNVPSRLKGLDVQTVQWCMCGGGGAD
jgi:hypothetical protein